MKKILFTIAATTMIFLSWLPAFGQSNHSRLDVSREDADLRVDKIRAHLDSIRRERHRPTVALVLSGGGAKGAAHVGVIRYLEEIGMPVDVVMGTSMGGLVGGIYSLGYCAPQLDSIIRSINWDVALSDKVPRDYLSYSQMKYKEKYALSFPFFYNTDDFLLQKEDELQYPHRSEGIHLGAGKVDASAMVRDNLMGSLPSGMVFGQNVNNIFASLSVGYQDETDFYDFPIPFLCVATDLVTGTAKIWTKGKINTALRSTMSIPGLFTPVKTDGMVLVDGGMRNNYPTDLAKKVGADIVIGVTLNSGYRGYSEINNLGDIIDTGIDMMGRNTFETNVDIPDVTIRPDMTGYGMMSFDSASVDTIINRGYASAVAVARQLDSLKRVVGKDTTILHNRVADNISKTPVMVSGIEINGVSDDESLFLMGKLKVAAGIRMNDSDIEDAVATIYGTDAFDYVNYELLGSEEPYRLKFNCKKGPIHKVGLGARFDTEEVVAVLLNVGLGSQKLQGHSLSLTGKVGSSPLAGLVYSHSNPKGLTVNAATSFHYIDKNTFSIGDNRYRINLSDFRAETYLSNINWYKAFFKTGVRFDRFNIGTLMAQQYIGDYNADLLKNGYVSCFLDGRNESFDNSYIPTIGKSFGISYQFVFAGLPNKVNPFHTIQMDAKRVVGGDKFAFIPSINLRYLFGADVPVMFSNVIGGTMDGRYLDQQVSFYGIENVACMKRMLGITRGEVRWKLMTNNYLSAIFNYATSANDLSAYKTWSSTDVIDIFGAAVQYTYNTIIGPIRADIHWSSYTKRLGVFLSMGFDF